MKYQLLFLVFIILCSCNSQRQKDEKIARQYCGSCHVFPDPSLLGKATWENDIFPQMAFRMGSNYSMLSTFSEGDQAEIIPSLPGKSMVSDEEWEAIKRYYHDHAPDSLVAPVLPVTNNIKGFDVEPFSFPGSPLVTFIQTDTLHHSIYVGSRAKKLFRLNEQLVVEDSFQLSSPPSWMIFSKSDEADVLLMGIMDPNDQPMGSLTSLNLRDHSQSAMMDSLKRPVYFQRADLDGDNLEDVVVCEFGNYTGALVAYQNLGNGNYKKHILQKLPGARKIVIRDIDNNGKADIVALMSQGDEKIILLLNQGNFGFRLNTLLSFPAVYGSSYFDLVDFNNDGNLDILYTNGDNADYSMVFKPYHGVRIFLNSGTNEFKESWFYNMHGASQAVAHDFDLDGDVDIAAISFFPDFKHHPEQGFIYFENTGTTFVPAVTSLAAAGRWLTIATADIDKDGDRDIMLGALNFSNGVPEALSTQWLNHPTTILLLRNSVH